MGPHFKILTDESARNLQFAEKFRSLGKIVSRVAAERRKKNIKSTDMLGMLMEARDRDSGQIMPDPQLVNEIMTLIVAGHETTASTLNWVWYLLSQHPEIEKRLWREPFSVGARNCIGEIFARLEMQIHLMTIAKQLRLGYEEEKAPELEAAVNLRSKYDFVMVPEIRASTNAYETYQPGLEISGQYIQ